MTTDHGGRSVADDPVGSGTSDPVRSVVMAVVKEALRITGAAGILLHRPGTPEHALLKGWAKDEGVRVVAAGAEGQAPPDFLSTDPANKLVLLLEGPLPGARLLPLGDLWPAGIVSRVGRASSPTGFDEDEETVASVVLALRLALEDGYGLGALGGRLPPALATRVRAALLRSAPRFRPPLIPKLTGWTPGIDPGL